MEQIFAFADDLGPAKVIQVHDPTIGLRGILVVDNVATGSSIGRARDPRRERARVFRLARAMTLKNAAAGLPHGGGKSVLFDDPRMPAADKERRLRAFAFALRHEDAYIFGPDMGTEPASAGRGASEDAGAVRAPVQTGAQRHLK